MDFLDQSGICSWDVVRIVDGFSMGPIKIVLNRQVTDNAPSTIANRLANPMANDGWEESTILVYLILCRVWEWDP